MQTSSRRTFIAWVIFLVGGTSLLEYLRRQGAPPDAEWVRQALWGKDVLAYVVLDGSPRVVLASGDRKVRYDEMVPGDWFWPMWPPRPQWQLKGAGYAIATSNAPASIGFAPCVGIYNERCDRAPELFGQIIDSGIVAMEVLSGGEWRRFPVASPGFAVRLDVTTGEPAGYRWLDAGNRVVWQTAVASPKHTRSQRKHSRSRSNATPVP